MDREGLNSLKYSVENVTEHRVYTLVKADVKEAFTDQLTDKESN